MSCRIVGLCILATLASNLTPAKADWVSLRDGGLVETKGPWREKGKTVVFTAASGALMSLRATEVDLEMSKELSARLKKASYVDFGATSNPTDPAEQQRLVDERGNAERAKLQRFVQDPNSPRVSGTLSAQSDAEALRILDDHLQGTDDEELRQDKSGCQNRYADSSAYSVCLMRAEIASEMRRKAQERAEE